MQMRPSISSRLSPLGLLLLLIGAAPLGARANGNVFISRFWHVHQPIYWPEWNGGVGQDFRVQYAHDSMRLKPVQNYGGASNHPENDLAAIFSLPDRVAAYQGRPRDALAKVGSEGGFAISYSGSLIDNVRNLSANNWNYGGGWNQGNREARTWLTPSGSRRMDMVGFTYHHSLAPLLPKEVLRKEVQIFKEAWWKAWGGAMDKSDHSRGFFPTEMAYSRDIIDVLSDEGYEWLIVPSHHISRTSPSYNDRVHPGRFQIKSSPPNRADQLGPGVGNESQWWFEEPNPGQGAWNAAPMAYQLYRVKYVNPATGAEKSMIAVPSDDVISYQAGYSGAQIGLVDGKIAPHAGEASRPVIVMPSTDGDNAWGGGYDSWEVSTPGFFGAAQSRGYRITTPQDFVNQFKQHAPTAHIEEGAWIYPEMCYGSPYFLKWIEPPVRQPGSTTTYPNTVIDVENGWSLKFFAYAPTMAGANWVQTAEQIWRDGGGTVAAWKIQAPYDWDGAWTSPNLVERAWHIYLAGLDSGFQYYGGLGNDDEVKTGLSARRAIEMLQGYMAANIQQDRTPPTALRAQRFPYNPGGYTFGWFNSIPDGDTSYLKKMSSDFHVWTLAHDVSGVEAVDLMIRRDKDGVRSLANNDNVTYAGGPDVEGWVRLPMTRRVLPNTRAQLNALANNGQIDYVITSPEIADAWSVKVTDSTLPGFRGNLFDYYLEARDTRGNVHRGDIQHVYVENDGAVLDPPAPPQNLSATPLGSTQVRLQWDAVTGASSYRISRDGAEIASVAASPFTDSGLTGGQTLEYVVRAVNASGVSAPSAPASATTPLPPPPPPAPQGLAATPLSHNAVGLSWDGVAGAALYRVFRDGIPVADTAQASYTDTGLEPSRAYAYTVAAGNEGGFSPPSPPATATTQAAPPSFALGAADDPMGYLLISPGMRIFAAVRGTLLYVATWTPVAANGNDHFIFVTDQLLPAATAPAPWAKAGNTALPPGKPYLAAESKNTYAAWVNTGGNGQISRAPNDGGRIEGVIDLVQVFGALPDRVYLSALAYQTDDEGALAGQAPAGNGDADIEPSEFFAIPIDSVRDSAANGVFDRLDPDRDFRLDSRRSTPAPLTLSWPVVPGRSYSVWRATSLAGVPQDWTQISVWNAPSGADMAEFPVPVETSPAAFYKIQLLP